MKKGASFSTQALGGQRGIILDGMRMPKAGLFPDSDEKIITGSDAIPYLTRWRLDLANNKLEEIQLDQNPAEFPRFDERFTGQSYRHGYAVGNDNFNTIIHYDLKLNTTTKCHLGDTKSASEVVFVPKYQNCAEVDGYLLTIVYDNVTHASVLLILDALRILDKPVATIELPHRIPKGFHGSWIGAAV